MATLAQAAPSPIRLEVDASDTRQRIFRVRESIPVQPGPLTLLYPQWIPGSHAPTGEITLLAGLQIQAAGRPLAWQRLPQEPFAFAVQVPAGVDRLELSFQYLSPLNDRQGDVVVTPDIVAVRWQSLLLYPRGEPVAQQPVEATLKLPEGWALATSLDEQGRSGARIGFRPVSVATLVDSPVWASPHLKRYELQAARPGVASVGLNVLADSAEDLQASPEALAAWTAMVRQATRVFGPLPVPRYEFLLSLNAGFMRVAREHQSSAELSTPPGLFSKWAAMVNERRNVPHEFVHAWNGKLRSPAGLAPDDFNTPLDTRDLWIYEGQTQYWGYVLRARSGDLSPAQALQLWAREAAAMAARRGNTWRSLQDTTLDPVMRYDRARAWGSWQRSADYYSEGTLLWLAVDARLRQLSGGQRSLDDLARTFFSAPPPARQRYERAELWAALEALAPGDWQRFIEGRLEGTGQDFVTRTLEAAGWRLVFKAQQSELDAAIDRLAGASDFSDSIGVAVANDGRLNTVRWESEAFRAGLAPGAQLVAVNGRSFSTALLREAIAEAGRTRQPLDLVVKADERFSTVRLRADEGLRYPQLERIPDRPDLLSVMLSPLP
ncbi:MAG: M61 family peptidase [Burkholderiales bacterium]|nr:MAG: M61 family peptidase [Burkholderiales bacterium]